MPKVTIVGAGNVGATAAHIIASKNLADVVLIDVAEGLPQGKALDMMHMRSVEQFTVKVIGTNDYADTRDSDVVVITAGIARKPGMTREDLLGVNAGIMKSVIGQAMEASPNAVFICVTNPLDVMTTLAFRESGLPANRLMGMGGVLDSSRLAFAVCEQLGCAPADVTAWAAATGQTDPVFEDFSAFGREQFAQNSTSRGADKFVEALGEEDAAAFRRDAPYGRVVTNPPYGERILEKREAEELYRAFGRAVRTLPEGWRVSVLSSHTEFERTFGRAADKKRKLYNGMLKCDLFQYGR